MKYQQLSLELGVIFTYETCSGTCDSYLDKMLKVVLEQDAPLVPEQKNVLEQNALSVPEQKNVPEHGAFVLKQHPDNKAKYATTSGNNPPKYSHWIEQYSPSRRKNYHYYRYVWMEGRKFHHFHIPGGNIRNQVSIARCREVERAIAHNKPPVEIIGMIRAWGLSV